MSQWQPIETAPKDGTEVLLWTDTRADADDTAYVEAVCEGEHVACAQIGYWDHDWTHMKIGAPTHWMPLPPAPEVSHVG